MVIYFFKMRFFVNKKFTLHLDVIVVLLLLFSMMLGLVIFQQSQLSMLTEENQKLQWQSLEDSLNLDSQASYINKLQRKLEMKDKAI